MSSSSDSSSSDDDIAKFASVVVTSDALQQEAAKSAEVRLAAPMHTHLRCAREGMPHAAACERVTSQSA